MAQAKPGPKPKDRTQRTLRIYRPYASHYEALAADAGMTMNDYFDAVMAKAHGLEDPPYLAENKLQPPLMAAS